MALSINGIHLAVALGRRRPDLLPGTIIANVQTCQTLAKAMVRRNVARIDGDDSDAKDARDVGRMRFYLQKYPGVSIVENTNGNEPSVYINWRAADGESDPAAASLAQLGYPLP